MTIRARLGIAAALGVLIAGVGDRGEARAQVGAANFNPYSGYGAYGGFGTYGGFGAYGFGSYWTIDLGTLGGPRVPRQGNWAEVINVTPKWIVLQDENGRQYPVAADAIKQFLVRWPSGVDQLTKGSLVEATGVNAGSNVVVADHMDVYEEDAQKLVTPDVTNLFGANRTLAGLEEDHANQDQVSYYVTDEEAAIPNRMNVVGRPVGINPVQLQVNGTNWVTLQGGPAGMTVTQVTLGSNSFARKGDVVYLISDGLASRTLNVAMMVLYKKIPFRMFGN